ncbi:hypothetical protein ON010_g9023 [Phytophthora cinnamomi]|nr:hypothetical protein ON010_g9023 [Phytophthora cinnamomi]
MDAKPVSRSVAESNVYDTPPAPFTTSSVLVYRLQGSAPDDSDYSMSNLQLIQQKLERSVRTGVDIAFEDEASRAKIQQLIEEMDAFTSANNALIAEVLNKHRKLNMCSPDLSIIEALDWS